MGTKQIEIRTVNAFTDNGVGGNPAGVVLGADFLSSEEKKILAGKVGLSETAFISKSDSAEFKLDFFTPVKQIPHCGHATIASFSLLAQLGLAGEKSSKETIDGNREVFLVKDEAYMEQLMPKYTDLTGYEQEIFSALGINAGDLLPEAVMMRVNTGNSFIIVPVASITILKNLKPDFEAIERLSEIFDLVGIYVFALETRIAGRDANSRMFAPRFGILEESATGMAAGPLGCYLYDIIGIRRPHLLIEQGNFMIPPAPSLLKVNLKLIDGAISSLLVGGTANIGGVATLEI